MHCIHTHTYRHILKVLNIVNGNFSEFEWQRHDYGLPKVMHNWLSKCLDLQSINCTGMSWLVERPHRNHHWQMPISKIKVDAPHFHGTRCVLSHAVWTLTFLLAELAHFIRSHNFAFHLFGVPLHVIRCTHFDWRRCYRCALLWMMFTNGENQIQFSSNSHTKCIRRTQRYYFLSLSLWPLLAAFGIELFSDSNWIFFAIGTECNLIAHQITIKCLTAYNAIVHKVCEWKPKPAPWIHANVNGWQLQMILLFRFLRMNFFPSSLHLLSSRWFKCVVCSISSVCLNRTHLIFLSCGSKIELCSTFSPSKWRVCILVLHSIHRVKWYRRQRRWR